MRFRRLDADEDLYMIQLHRHKKMKIIEDKLRDMENTMRALIIHVQL